MDRAHSWFARHGGSAVLIGRMVPVVRGLISLPAGLNRMPLPRFVLYTAIGSGALNLLLIGLGWALGDRWGRVAGRWHRQGPVAPVVEADGRCRNPGPKGDFETFMWRY